MLPCKHIICRYCRCEERLTMCTRCLNHYSRSVVTSGTPVRALVRNQVLVLDHPVIKIESEEEVIEVDSD
jgi:hypothetical protein